MIWFKVGGNGNETFRTLFNDLPFVNVFAVFKRGLGFGVSLANLGLLYSHVP